MLPKHIVLFVASLLCLDVATALDGAPPEPFRPVRAHIEALRTPGGDAPKTARRTIDLLDRFYALRNDTPAWGAPGRLAALIAELDALADDGLRPEDYGVDALRRHLDHPPADAVERICVDLLASRAYLTALLHLKFGRLDRATVEPQWQYGSSAGQPAAEAQLLVDAAVGVADPASVFAQARPALPDYRALRTAYVTLRAHAAAEIPAPLVPAGPLLRPGADAPRVVLVRGRLAVAGYAATNVGPPQVFDDALLATLVSFQHDHGLEPDGIVGPATLAALNLSHADRLDRLRANLERLRWLAADLHDELVLVDVAGARITYFRNGDAVWSARTQVGRPERPTPLLKSQITHFTFNPTWTIPPTILQRDKLPEIRRDPDYLAKNRIRVLDHAGNEIDPSTVDWAHPGAILLRQDAGEYNALGQVAIRFPNPFAVYLHDTPSRRLFARERRTVSSGCVRVEHAMELVDLLLDTTGTGERERIGAILASGHTRNVSLARPVPLLIAYLTAHADADGHVRLRPDPYQLDRGLARALAAPAPVPIRHPCPVH